jgi:hypothetical protein
MMPDDEQIELIYPDSDKITSYSLKYVSNP